MGKKRIIISESSFLKLVNHPSLLQENLGRQMHKARRVLGDFGYTASHCTELVQHWQHKRCFAQNNGFGLPGYARLFGEGEIEPTNSFSIEKIIDLIANKYQGQITTYLEKDGKPLDAYDLEMEFGNEANEFRKRKRKNDVYIKPNEHYKIYRIANFEDAEKWSDSCDWCITNDAKAYDRETNEGSGIFIFCIRDDYNREIHNEPNQETPLTNYGLSMIAVCIEKDGSIASCTSRYNHSDDELKIDGNMLDESGLEVLLGVNFEDVFYPRNEEIEPYTKPLTQEEWQRIVFDDAVWLNDKFCLCQDVNKEEYVLEDKECYAVAYWDKEEPQAYPYERSNFIFNKNSKYEWHNNVLIIQAADGYYHVFGLEDHSIINDGMMLSEITDDVISYEIQHDILIAKRESYDGSSINLFIVNLESLNEIDTIDDKYRFYSLQTNHGEELYMETWRSKYDALPFKSLHMIDLDMKTILDDETPYNNPNFYTIKYNGDFVIPCVGDDGVEADLHNPLKKDDIIATIPWH